MSLSVVDRKILLFARIRRRFLIVIICFGVLVWLLPHLQLLPLWQLWSLLWRPLLWPLLLLLQWLLSRQYYCCHCCQGCYYICRFFKYCYDYYRSVIAAATVTVTTSITAAAITRTLLLLVLMSLLPVLLLPQMGHLSWLLQLLLWLWLWLRTKLLLPSLWRPQTSVIWTCPLAALLSLPMLWKLLQLLLLLLWLHFLLVLILLLHCCWCLFGYKTAGAVVTVAAATIALLWFTTNALPWMLGYSYSKF